MSSTPSIASPVTSTSSGNISSNSQPQSNAVGRSTMKQQSGSVKVGDGSRKQSPVDGTSRRPQSQKAWTPGTNPLTQRAPSASQQNGNAPPSKPVQNVSKTPTSKEGGLSDKHSHDRLRYLLVGAIGLPIVIITKAGDQFEGILAGSAISMGNMKLSLQMTRKMQNPSAQANGVTLREAAFTGTSPEHAMNFDLRDVADLSIPEYSPPMAPKASNGFQGGFLTDTDISGNTSRGEKMLQKWVPDAPNDTDFSLESSGGGTSDWDQFATNNQLFGTQSTYDENLYTTAIDRSAPSYRQREADAARIAREIENSTSGDAHIREERGQTGNIDSIDEEEKYSGVRRDDRAFRPLAVGGTNKYTPPARRPPTAQPLVAGLPVDSAIISAQLSDTTGVGSSLNPVAAVAEVAELSEATDTTQPLPSDGKSSVEAPEASATQSTESKNSTMEDDVGVQSTNSNLPDNATAGVEVKVLQQFRQFADAEKHKFAEKRRLQASQDRTAKLNDLLHFSKTFKLKAPVPKDLVGILAKDPKKQEAILQKGQKGNEESRASSGASSPAPAGVASSRPIATGKFDSTMVPGPIPDRSTFNRGRGGFPQNVGTRIDRSTLQQPAPGRGNPTTVTPMSPTVVQDRKASQIHAVPAPIPLVETRISPLNTTADQTILASPQRSTMHTPTSTVSTKFNVRASEFRPNIAAPAFNPVSGPKTPSSSGSVAHPPSASGTATPTSFFGSRKPKSPSERPSISDDFNPIMRMKQEFAPKQSNETAQKPDEPQKDFTPNGGIPQAYHTVPRWTVKTENEDISYTSSFERPMHTTTSPAQSRSSSSHHVSYQQQISHLQNGAPSIPQISTPHHPGPTAGQGYPHQFEDPQHRGQMPMSSSPQVFHSPAVPSRQMSAYASPMGPSAQLVGYGQAPYFGAPSNQLQMPIQMRQYSGTPSMSHAQPGQLSAPMMVGQPSNGPYIMPQHFNPQMSMYSPVPSNAYPQQNGFSSPGRVAPMMMHQNSQQGHYQGQPVMYAVPNQGQAGPLLYGQQGQMPMIRGYTQQTPVPYGASPHHLQQRTMSSGYGHLQQKMMPQAMQYQGPPTNAQQQSAAHSHIDVGLEGNK